MSLGEYLSTNYIYIGEDSDKKEFVRKLISLIYDKESKEWGNLIEALVEKREQTLTTRVSSTIAIPHAVVEGLEDNRIAVGISKQGILWDDDQENPIHIVVLLIGRRADHLRLLNLITSKLQDPGIMERLIRAETKEEVHHILTPPSPEDKHPVVYNNRDISRLTFDQAIGICRQLGGARLVLHADAIEDPAYIIDLISGTDAIIVTRTEDKFTKEDYKNHSIVLLPFKGIRRSAHVQFALLFLLSRELIEKDDVIVNLYGVPDSGYFDSIRLTYMQHEFDFPFTFGKSKLPQGLGQHVLTRVLQIAGELATEGREGKPVGTLFVLGDYEKVKTYTKQLIVNPFAGYGESQRNILDPAIEETVKEYAKIDGAFILRGDGILMSAGTFISGDPQAEELQSGLGARHAAALGITAVTEALAIVISESTRKVSIFHGGKKIVFM